MRREASAVKSSCYIYFVLLLFETEEGELSNIEACHLERHGDAPCVIRLP